MILMNLWVAGTLDTAPGFGGSILSINSNSFPGMQVVLQFMTFHLGDRLICFMAPGSSFMFTDVSAGLTQMLGLVVFRIYVPLIHLIKFQDLALGLEPSPD